MNIPLLPEAELWNGRNVRNVSAGGLYRTAGPRCDVEVIVPNEMISRHNTGVMSPPCSRYCNASAGIANTQSNGLTSSSDHCHTTTNLQTCNKMGISVLVCSECFQTLFLFLCVDGQGWSYDYA